MRSAWILTALLCSLATGCQTFHRYGYPHDYVGPYGTGTYAPSSTMPPSGTTVSPTPAPNLGTSVQPWPNAAPTSNLPRGYASPLNASPTQPSTLPTGVPSSKPVPNYENKRPPATLGAPIESSQGDFKNPTSSLGTPGSVRLSSVTDDSEENLASLGDEGFAKPVPVLAASNSTPAPSRVSPYRKDRAGYSWLRGVVAFDEAEQKWRLTYSSEPSANDPYQGNFVLVGHEQLDNLLPDDVVLVEGAIEPAMKDRRFGKPSYRVRQLKRLEPLGEE